MDSADARETARATWAAADYEVIASYIWPVGKDLIERVGVGRGDEVLDVACGSGNAAIPAAVAGGRVTGLDLTPELFQAGRRRAREAGVEIAWTEGDAEELPFADAGFDVVVSVFGCMFAPRHEVAAAEIARVVKPGGRLGIASWTPDGNIGSFFRTIAAHAPPPPEGFQPPPLWGSEEHVEALFAGSEIDLRFEPAAVTFRFGSIDEAVEEYSTKFGPVVKLRAALEPEGRWPELRRDLEAYFDDVNEGSDGALQWRGQYLIALGTRPA